MVKSTEADKAVERRVKEQQAKYMKQEREQKSKRGDGLVKKSAQLGMLPDIECAMFIHDLKTDKWRTFQSTDDKCWRPAINYIKQISPDSEHLLQSDFVIVERDNDKQNSPRKVLPDIRIKSSSKKRQGRKPMRQQTNTFSQIKNTRTQERRRLPGTPPPPLPDLIRDMALQHRMNTIIHFPDLPTRLMGQTSEAVMDGI